MRTILSTALAVTLMLGAANASAWSKFVPPDECPDGTDGYGNCLPFSPGPDGQEQAEPAEASAPAPSPAPSPESYETKDPSPPTQDRNT